MEIEAADLSVHLTAALGRASGFGAVRGLKRLSAGATKATWAFEAQAQEGWTPLILQMSSMDQSRDRTDPSSRLPWLAGGDEFRVMRAACHSGVAVPQVVHLLAPEDRMGEGAITLHIEGETLARRILRDPAFAAARARMAGEIGAIAARIHLMETNGLEFLQRFDAETLLEVYCAVLASMPDSYPALEFALRWADENRPRPSRPGVVHGDLRLGNVIVDAVGIRALLDWEIAHIGDPMEDLGYVCLRTWRFGAAGKVAGVGSREELYAAYEASGGGAVDPAVARFWEVMAGIKWALGCIRRGEQARRNGWRPMEYAAIGRRVEEPLLDLLDVIEGRD